MTIILPFVKGEEMLTYMRLVLLYTIMPQKVVLLRISHPYHKSDGDVDARLDA